MRLKGGELLLDLTDKNINEPDDYIWDLSDEQINAIRTKGLKLKLKLKNEIFVHNIEFFDYDLVNNRLGLTITLNQESVSIVISLTDKQLYISL